MNSLPALIASLALMLPAAPAGVPAREGNALTAEEGAAPASLGFDISAHDPWLGLFNSQDPETRDQVRIEQRIILRITPRPQASREDLLAQLPRGEVSTHLEERKMGSCLPLQGIAGVGTASDNRLILFMRDQRIVSAALEKACRARDFYSGFYVERSKDGNLCVKRDQIQSRAGAKCELSQLRQLVAVKD